MNIPLLDAIKQIPPYAKFLKDLCTMKSKLGVHNDAFMTEQSTSLIRNNSQPPPSPQIQRPRKPHHFHSGRKLEVGMCFSRLGSECEFVSILGACCAKVRRLRAY